MSLEQDIQKVLVRSVIHYLETSKMYCEMAWSMGVLSADLEPHNIQNLIDLAIEQLEEIDAEWDIEVGVLDGQHSRS